MDFIVLVPVHMTNTLDSWYCRKVCPSDKQTVGYKNILQTFCRGRSKLESFLLFPWQSHLNKRPHQFLPWSWTDPGEPTDTDQDFLFSNITPPPPSFLPQVNRGLPQTHASLRWFTAYALTITSRWHHLTTSQTIIRHSLLLEGEVAVMLG